MKKLIISSILIFIFGCSLSWVDKERKCHGSDYESGYDLGGRWISWYLSWKCEVRKDPKDMKHIKRMGGGYMVNLWSYQRAEPRQRACQVFKSKGLECWGSEFAKLCDQIQSALPTDHYELMYNDGTIINLPLFENDVPKNESVTSKK